MATSTNFGWTEPDDTDLVKNGAAAMRTLGNAIDSSLYNAVGKAAGKNAVINGGFDIWQRGTSIALTAASAGSGYLADRWQGYRGVAGSTCSRQTTSDTTNLAFIQYCSRVQRDSGNTSTSNISIGQSIESANAIPFAGKIVTLSFYARAGANYSATSSLLRVRLLSSTVTDQNILVNGGTTVIDQNATLTTTWQRFSYTSAAVVGATAVTLGSILSYDPVGTAGANDYFEVTGVQLELGSTATPFSRAGGTIQGELAACQRYYAKSYDLATAPATNNTGNGVHYSQQSANVANSTNHSFIKWPVNMRTAPTVTIYSYTSSTSGAISTASTTDLAANSGVANRIGESGASIYNNSGGTINVAGNGFIFHWVASAEL